MAMENWRVLVAGLWLVGACGGDDGAATPTDDTSTSPDGGSATVHKDAGKTPTKNDAGQTTQDPPDINTPPATLDDGGTAPDQTPPGTGDAGVPDGPLSDDKCDYESKTVMLTKDLVVPAGKTVHVCEGTSFTAATDVKIDVLGALIVDGTADAPVSFNATTTGPRNWHGIVIEKGGSLMMTHGVVGDAIYGVTASAGSSYTIDRSEFGGSFKAVVLLADGTVTNSKFAAAPVTSTGFAVTDAVSIDDPNGSMTIIDASPHVSNCTFDGASGLVDMVRVGGNASPTFDHVQVHNAHCGFHTSGGTNTSAHITNSVFFNLAYGIMAYATKPVIENSVFHDNSNDIGECTGATSDNTPVLMNNNYKKGAPTIDASCFAIGTAEATPAATANPTAGPSGL